MSFCGSCGAKLTDNAVFCGKCGARISKLSSSESFIIDPIIGEDLSFSFYNETINVPKKLNIYNTYRLKYRGLPLSCLNEAKRLYNTRIKDLDTFVENFPNIYYSNLDILIQSATDLLIAENIWTATFDSLKNEHLKHYHEAIDIYNDIERKIEEVIKTQQQSRSKAMSYLPKFVGHGTGLSGAIKSAATAYAFNAAKEGITSSLVKNANIKPAQKEAIYHSLNLDKLMENVFFDYWNVYLSLIWVLKEAGRDIWWQESSLTQNAKNIFSNLSNPRFPQDKLRETWVQIVNTNPYNADYYKYAIDKFGETEELKTIKNYFGYTDLYNPYIV